jgi:transposase-like protein
VAGREITRLRSEILEARKAGKRARYPAELKARVMACVSRRHTRGQSYVGIAGELGLGQSTLAAWKAGGAELVREPRLRRVMVSEHSEAGERRFSVEGRAGLRVVGLSLDEVRELLGGKS